MTVEEMLYEFDLSTDAVDSKRLNGIPLPAKIVYLNRGQEAFVMNAYESSRRQDVAFETKRKITEQLAQLHITNENGKIQGVSSKLFVVDLSTLANEKLIVTKVRAYGSKGDCKDQELKAIETQTDDFDNITSAFKSPNFNWRRVLHRTAAKGIEFYTDGLFKVSKVTLDYLKKPKRIDIAGYTRFTDEESEDSQCELPDVLAQRSIIAEAALQFKMDISNPSFQFEQLKSDKHS